MRLASRHARILTNVRTVSAAARAPEGALPAPLTATRVTEPATTRPDVRLIIVRASDTPTYVQHGAADLGIAGKDVLLEHGFARPNQSYAVQLEYIVAKTNENALALCIKHEPILITDEYRKEFYRKLYRN